MESIPSLCSFLYSMKNKKAIVWDWNGTLVDDAFVFVEIMNLYLSSSGLPLISLADYRNNFCFPVINYYKKLGFSLSQKDFDRLTVDFIEKYKKRMFKPVLKNGMQEVLSSIKKSGCDQLLVSAQEQKLLNKTTSFYGVGHFFNIIAGLNNNLAVSKKNVAHKTLLPYIKKDYSFLFVGDTLHDFEVASSLGAKCCLVTWGHNSKKLLKQTKQPVVSSPQSLFLFINHFLSDIN